MALRNLIPPKVASAASLAGAPTAKRMTTVVDFYSKLPKGAASKSGSSLNPFSAYRQKYFEGNASGAPIVHLIGALFLLGYTIDYQRHLKHHKNNVH